MRFHVGDVLSVSTGRVCRVPMRVQELVEFLCGFPVWTHQLPRLAGPCKAYLNEKYPALAPFAESITSLTYQEETARAISILGEEMDIEAMPPGYAEQRDPLAELSGMLRPDQKIVVVETK